MKTFEIQAELRRLENQIGGGDDSQVVVWIVENKLAVAHRPLRYDPVFGGSGRRLSPEASGAVRIWVERMRDQYDIRSIICLMHPKELQHYADLNLHPWGLLGLYEEVGIKVWYVPWADPAHGRTPEDRAKLRGQVEDVKTNANRAFGSLPKPTLLHCSAGIDRTSPVAAFISEQLT